MYQETNHNGNLFINRKSNTSNQNLTEKTSFGLYNILMSVLPAFSTKWPQISIILNGIFLLYDTRTAALTNMKSTHVIHFYW